MAANFVLFGLRETLEFEYRRQFGSDPSLVFTKARTLIKLSRSLADRGATALVINAAARRWELDVCVELARRCLTPVELLRDDDDSVRDLAAIVDRHKTSFEQT